MGKNYAILNQYCTKVKKERKAMTARDIMNGSVNFKNG
jgi:hypothetical protein